VRITVEPFEVNIDTTALDDLRSRIRATRWPDPAPGPAWSQGTDLDYLRDLLAYWADGFDWAAQQEALNRYRHYIANVDGVRVHFVHHRGDGPPIVLTHGWPSTFAEMLPLVDRLGGSYDLVVPSLPGYGFSPRPPRVGVDRAFVARRWHGLMQGLGYRRYGAHGGDFGAGVATHMALADPARMNGIHLPTPEMIPYTGPGTPPLTPQEKRYLEQVAHWDDTERGYSAIQSTKPQTVGYGLADSPAGLAAWLIEKWRSWGDTGGDVDHRFGRDALLTMITLYWVTNSITSSIRDYLDNRWHGTPIGPGDHVEVPTAMAVFGHAFVHEGDLPRSYCERLYDIRRWTVFPRGGHFGAAEEPDLVAGDIDAFFRDRT
jgi:pimeloyl-ACP methyl ester carboxylesterase